MHGANNVKHDPQLHKNQVPYLTTAKANAVSAVLSAQSYEVQRQLYSPSKILRCSFDSILRPRLWGAESVVSFGPKYAQNDRLVTESLWTY